MMHPAKNSLLNVMENMIHDPALLRNSKDHRVAGRFTDNALASPCPLVYLIVLHESAYYGTILTMACLMLASFLHADITGLTDPINILTQDILGEVGEHGIADDLRKVIAWEGALFKST